MAVASRYKNTVQKCHLLGRELLVVDLNKSTKEQVIMANTDTPLSITRWQLHTIIR